MLNPTRLVNDLFADRELFDGNLRPFTEDHLLRLAISANNPGGIYNPLLSSTSTKYTNYFGKITDEITKKSISEGLTINMNNARTAAEAKISQLQNLVKYKFGETSGIYQEFYPLGMDDYYQTRIGEIYPKFLRFVNAATANLTADHPAEVTAITGLVANFQSARSAQETMFGEIDAIGSGKGQDRKILTLQLTTNFLTIALNNIDNPTRFDDYYDARYLPITHDAGATPVLKEGAVNAGMNQNIDLSDIPDADVNSNLKLFNPNSGSIVLRYYYADTTAGFPMPTVYVDVNPGETLDKVASQLGATSTNTYLMVQNLSGTNGDYKVEIVA